MMFLSFFVALVCLASSASAFNDATQTPVKCSACVAVMGLLEGTMARAKNQTLTAAALKRDCSKLPRVLQKECDKLAVDVGKALPAISWWLNFHLYKPYALCSVISLCKLDCCGTDRAPQQLVVSYDGGFGSDGAGGQTPPSLWASWVGPVDSDPVQTLQWSSRPFSEANASAAGVTEVTAQRSTYTKGGWLGAVFRAPLRGLASYSTHYYRVGGPVDGWSPVHSVRMPAHSLNDLRRARAPAQDTTFRAVMIADMGAGNESDATVAALADLSRRDAMDIVLHVGDMSYADCYQRQWDVYGRKISAAFSAHIPLAHVVGNHEVCYNFTAFRHRVHVPRPAGATRLYWSTDVGPMHLVGLNAEGLYDEPYVDDEQVAWLREDLKAATAPGRRGPDRPWIVAMVHRPLYCASPGDGHMCSKETAYLRSKYEALLVEFKVDLILSGHVHNFQRFWPTDGDRVVRNYNMPGVPTHYLMGASGCREGLDERFYSPLPGFVAANIAERGYSTLDFNKTAVSISFWGVDGANKGKALDQFTLTRG